MNHDFLNLSVVDVSSMRVDMQTNLGTSTRVRIDCLVPRDQTGVTMQALQATVLEQAAELMLERARMFREAEASV
jgi:molybdenum cofactor biosynthesis enzyme